MLVLSRKSNEEILIAGEIRVKVIEITNSRVKLGICAPDDVIVMREELALHSTTGPLLSRETRPLKAIPLKG